ncbi:unnamed protein product [Mesocestoides corti]|uniref:Transmembrane protein 256 homolog n=1 Tax=Mesocestoides corti TaxID=53468 RepID=A0A0R3UPN9_MESCO|nr:unnamed protein product [Mesocestoides corti]
METLKWAWGYVTWPVARAAEKAPEIPIRTPGGIYVKIAGLLGASAVAALAYAGHGKSNSKDLEKRRQTFKTGAQIHIIHSVAFLCVRNSRYPALTASLFLTGTCLFSVTCYYTAITNNRSIVMAAPVGGITLMLAWLSFVL